MARYDEQIEWNINQDYGHILASQINNVREAARAGDSMKWYNDLSVLYALVAGHKKMEEVSDGLRKELEECSKVLESGVQGLSLESAKAKEKRVKKRLFNFMVKLLSLMHQAGLWFDVVPEDKRKDIYKSF